MRQLSQLLDQLYSKLASPDKCELPCDIHISQYETNSKFEKSMPQTLIDLSFGILALGICFDIRDSIFEIYEDIGSVA
jgi:hypothetical protein